MAISGLATEWEAMSHSARVRGAIVVGRQSRSDAAAAGLLREWSSGGSTQRLMAAFAGHGSRDPAAMLALTADPSRIIARVAVSVLCHVGDDDDSLLATLRDLPPRRAARGLYRLSRPRSGVVDRFVAGLAAAGDGAAWPLVPLASAAVLDRLFAPAAERGGPTFWRRLAALHPARAAAEMIARLGATATPDGLVFASARILVRILADRVSDATMDVVEAFRRHVPLATIPLQTLANRRPVPVADLALAASRPITAQFQRVVRRLDVPRIVAPYRQNPSYLGNLGWWIARLPAPDGGAVDRALAPAWTDDDGVVADALLRRLPGPDADRRQLAQPRGRGAGRRPGHHRRPPAAGLAGAGRLPGAAHPHRMGLQRGRLDGPDRGACPGGARPHQHRGARARRELGAAYGGAQLPEPPPPGPAHAVPRPADRLRPLQHREGAPRAAPDDRDVPLDRRAAGDLRRVARGAGEDGLETG